MTNDRLFYPWCFLAGVIFLVSILSSGSPVYHLIATVDSNRWIHFFAYASMATIPVAVWKGKTNVLLSFIPAIMSIVLELLQDHFGGPFIRTQNVSADLFGIAAGVLLGLNIRVMRNPAKSLNSVSSTPSRSAMY
jgi:hypothetical protein